PCIRRLVVAASLFLIAHTVSPVARKRNHTFEMFAPESCHFSTAAVSSTRTAIKPPGEGHVFSGVYSQKSFLSIAPSKPVPIYPLFPVENPAATYLGDPPKSAFFVQVSAEGSYSQKSL